LQRSSRPGPETTADEGGFTLIVVLIAVAITSVLLSAAVTTWTHVMQRADEAELIWRGRQYAKAIECYVGQRAVPPTELEQLVDARCIRKLYAQPLADDGSWRLVRAAAPGVVPTADREEESGRGLRTNLRSSEPIIGVAPGITGTAIRAYDDSFDYEDWEFVLGDDEPPPVRALGLPPGFRGDESLEEILERQRGRARSKSKSGR
jgi:type II secretory pathway pseudopilin PulG